MPDVGNGRTGGAPIPRGPLRRQLIITFAVVFLLVGGTLVIILAVVPAQVARSHLTAGTQQALQASLDWAAGLIATAALFGLAAALTIRRSVLVPLMILRGVIQRRRGGDIAARARVTGVAEVRAVAEEFNTLADDNDRMQAEQAQRTRLRAAAREAGLRIRAELTPEGVLGEARRTVEAVIGANAAYLHLADEHGRFGVPVSAPDSHLLPPGVFSELPPQSIPLADELFRAGRCLVIQDVASPAGEPIPPPIRAQLLAAGISFFLLAPFGREGQLLGILIALRRSPAHAWTQSEIETVESLTADIGAGLHNARLFQREKELVAKLTAVNEMRTEFFSTVAHELRAPLTSIEGYVEMLRDETGGPVTLGQRDMLGAIERGAARLRTLIKDLLTLSRLESGAAEAAAAPVDLVPLLHTAASDIRPAVITGGLTLTASAPDRLMVTGDAVQLDQALGNLLSNAVKYTPRGGRIELTATAAGGHAVMTIRDTGIGIPAADQDRLFTRFFRASNALRSRAPGTGLGLAITRAILAAHHGDIAIDSREGTGTTATITLPLASAD